MFRPAITRPLLARPLASSPLRACLSTATPLLNKPAIATPSIGQLPKDSQSKFDANLAAFREKQAAQQEAARKEAAEAAAAARAAASTGQPDAAAEGPDIKTGGVFSKLLHGSSEAQQDTFQIQESFSKVLARGKYVHELVFHRIRPDKLDEYIELIGNEYPRIAGDKNAGVKLVGSWATEIGEGDTFVHIWEYNGYAGYHDTLRYLEGQQSTQKYKKEVRKYLQSRSNSLAQEFSFWPTTQPRNLGGVFELRSYTLHPGNLLEWETHWRRGLVARQSQGMEGVGAWFTQIGGLNEVHYLWQFGDLRGRQVLREKSWQAEGWADTVHKTIPLIAKMQSKIILPLPWSPVK
ncbi:hypothetical protein H072_9689 [Dactylellina haptotyla CBS 200.50]|uniref:NIPSNAP domain-containing protein n=1 Tax=Dactylellina haptotyla (strain CBS 200.50) TaxID=1284197 RepID=S8A252_DACHA|nr:hypothetical protein H072_9689 [Dactylellina haptotyla CBS 200.50]